MEKVVFRLKVSSSWGFLELEFVFLLELEVGKVLLVEVYIRRVSRVLELLVYLFLGDRLRVFNKFIRDS